MEMTRRALLLVALLLIPAAARAEAGESPEKTVAAARAAVERGAFNEAVDALEALSDRGFSHPGVSYARAQAYLERARSRSAKPGDLGRAVAALEEYRRERPSDSARAERALETLRSEIARRRVRSGSSPVNQGLSIGRALVGLASENVWAVIAALGSALLTLGLAIRRLSARRSAEIAGAVGIAAGLVLGVLGAGLTAAARHYRTTSQAAVVVVPEARLFDAAGRPLPTAGGGSNLIPEGALVYVRGRQSGYFDVEWGAIRGHVDAAQLRLLPP
jgi:hypothetical protein